MNTGSFRVSRWVMLVETIGGFGPIAFAWFDVSFGASGIIRLNGEIIGKFFLGFPGGTVMLVMMFVGAIVGLLGPVGLFLGLRYALTGRALKHRALGWFLVVTPLAANLLGIMGRYLWGPPGFKLDGFTFFNYTLMITWMPVAVIAHLMYLAHPLAPRAPLASTA